MFDRILTLKYLARIITPFKAVKTHVSWDQNLFGTNQYYILQSTRNFVFK